jgi:hypothetical protein
VLGVDVYATPFDHAAGCTHYHANAADVALLRLEDMPRAFGPAAAGLLGLPRQPPLLRSNQRADSVDAEAYAAARQAIVVPEPICRTIYGTRMARHFYTLQEREAQIRHWSAPRT